jgi:hypothetical protein
VRRRAGLAIALVTAVVALGAAGSAGADPSLSFACFAPSGAAISCDGWHTSPVTLVWTASDPGHPYDTSGCETQTYSKDVASLTVTCRVDELDTGTSLQKTVKLHIDMTPPQVTGAVPQRPADHNGWWNHPIPLAFQGTDATSGIASCDTVTYSQPDSAAAVVTGSCRDVAGNTAVGTFTLAYDATPPQLGDVSPIAGDGRVTLSWHASSDTAFVDVVRSPGTIRAPSTTLYSGRATRFTDSKAANRTMYRYTVIAYDAAGNTAAVTVSATPSALQPAAGARLGSAPTLRWQPVAHARYYNVQVFRGRRKILSSWPAHTRLRLRSHWTFDGHRYTLADGRYRWYVWPGFGSRAAHRYGDLIGQSSFRLVRH